MPQKNFGRGNFRPGYGLRPGYGYGQYGRGNFGHRPFNNFGRGGYSGHFGGYLRGVNYQGHIAFQESVYPNHATGFTCATSFACPSASG